MNDGADDDAILTADTTGVTGRSEFEDRLVLYDGRVAGLKAECGRLEEARDAAKIEYDRVREQREGVLRELGKQVAGRQVTIDEYEVEKRRLTDLLAAHWAAWDALYERRRAQYDHTLADLRANKAFVEGKFLAAAEKNRRKIVLTDAIASVSQLIHDLEEKHRESLYVAGQSVVYRIVKLNNEQESGIANMFETVLMNFKCDQTNLIQNITEYYNTVKEISVSQKNWFTMQKKIEKFVKNHGDKRIDMLSQPDEIKIFISMNDLMNTNIYNLTKKIENANLERNRLITESNDKKRMQIENIKYKQTLNELENDIKKEKYSLNELKQEIITENELRNEKCKYAKEIIDRIAMIIEELKKYMIGEKQLTDNLENMNWLLNMMRPLVNTKIYKACANKH